MTGIYMIVSLVFRIIINIPCLIIVLIYYFHKTKRESQLKQMLKPIKQNILNGEMLKRYENVAIDEIKDSNNNDQQSTLNETLIQKAIDAFIAKLDNDENVNKNEICEENHRILISEEDKLKLIKLKEQIENQNDEKFNSDTTNVVNNDNIININKPPLYSRSKSEQLKPKTNEIRVNLKNDDQLEIDIDEFNKNSKLNRIEIDIEKPLNEIKIDYNKKTNEIKINLLNPRQRPRPQQRQQQQNVKPHFIYLPPVTIVNESLTKYYDNKSNDIVNSEPDVLTRVGNSCDCVNIISCEKTNLNEQLIHHTNCFQSNNRMRTFKPQFN
jgi:hypothetical protein